MSQEQKLVLYQTNLSIYEKVKAQFESESKSKSCGPILLEVPDYLLCRITDEIMEEPVILESGFTYERDKIIEHF